MFKWKILIILSGIRKNRMSNSISYNKHDNSLDRSTSSKDQKDLYESVFHKQYQIIQTFLQKINSLYSKNEQFQNSLNILQEKLTKIQGNNANIHYQFRTTHFMMDKRLNTIMADYSNISQQIHQLRSDIPIDSIDNQHLTRSHLLKKRTTKKRQKIQSSNGSILPTIIINHIESQLGSVPKLSKVQSSLDVGQRKDLTNLQEMRRISQTCKAIDHQQSKSSDSQSQASFEEQESQQQLKPQKYCKQEPQKQKFGIVYSMEWVQNQIAKQMEKINTKIDTFLQQWKEQKIKIKEQIFGQQAQRFFSRLQLKIQERLNKMQIRCYEQQQKIRKQIQTVNETSLKNIGALQYKLSQKVQNQYFEDSMNNLTTAISLQLSNKQKYYSNKHQTQRAIRFLQNKINKIIQEEQTVNNTTVKSPKQSKIGQQVCLRINRCTSQKKSQVSASQKNINSKALQNSNSGLNSLNFSAIDEQQNQQYSTCKENKSNVNSNDLRKINWKGIQGDKISTFKIHSQAKIRKSSITKVEPFKTRSSYSNFAPVEKVIEKQWKQKVVKVLNSGDRKRVKVTFH